MNAKAAAAIAITLAIAAPIMIGYMLNINEIERTGWEGSDKTNITDLILNNNEPYYTRSYSAGNNAELYVNIFYSGMGINEKRIIAPDYLDQGTTYSSLPIYSSTTDTYPLENYTSTTTAGHSITESATGITYGDEIPENKAYYYFSSTELSQFNGAVNNDLGLNFGPFLKNNTNYWKWTHNTTVIDMDDNSSLVSDRNPTFTIISRDWTDLEIDGDYSTSFTGDAAIYLTRSGADDLIVHSRPDNQTTILKAGNTVIINGEWVYTNVTMVSVAPGAAAGNSITYSEVTQTGTYANTGYGWTVPTTYDGGSVTSVAWMNGQFNETVRLMIDVEQGESTGIQAVSSDGTYSQWISINHSSANVTVDGKKLGNYRYVCADIGKTSVKVWGLSSWPGMGTEPDKLNSVTVNYNTDLDDVFQVGLSGNNSVNYRVDYADIMAGTYPNTYNATLDLTQYYPDKSCAMSFTSIGVYGDSITFGGQTFAVNDGKILVNSKNVSLKDCVFTITYDPGTSTWSNSINNFEISNGSASTIAFNGIWSVTIAGYTVSQVTGSTLEWEVGGFGIDKSDFGLIGVIVCLGLFIALGLYGRRSENKMVWLILILGGAALIFFVII